MKLKLGIMTNKELAEWFGVTYDTFKHSRIKKLDELKNFADFKELRGKVKIINIKRSEYKKPAEIVKDDFKNYWSENGIDTCSRVALTVSNDMGVSLATAAEYVRKARDYYYGSPLIKKHKDGTLGCCRFIWTKINRKGEFHFEPVGGETLNEIELIYKEIIGSCMVKDINIKEAIKNGIINKEDLWRMYVDDIEEDEEGRYVLFLDTVRERLGIDIAKATIILNKGQETIEVEDATTILTIDDKGNIKVKRKNEMINFLAE